MNALEQIRLALTNLDQGVGAATHAEEDFKQASNAFYAAAKTVAGDGGTGAVLATRAVTLAQALESVIGRAEQLAVDAERWHDTLLG